MSVIRLRAPLACRIAKYDRDRLNEAAARDECPFLPPAFPGRPRLFTVPDVVALFVYARLVERHVQSSEAGRIAKDVGDLAKSLDDSFKTDVGITLADTLAGMRHEGFSLNVTISDLGSTKRVKEMLKKREDIQNESRREVMSPSIRSIGGDQISLGDLVYRQETWQIAPILKHIEHEIEQYRNTLGEEELG